MEEKYGTVQEAMIYYGIAIGTLHNWRRAGKIKSIEAPTGNRVGYKYLLDPKLKEHIEIMKSLDNRWS